MTRRHDEKGDETVAFRVPEKIAAGIRDRARWNDLTPSELMRRIVEQFLVEGNVANVSPENVMFANKSKTDVSAALEAAKTAIEEAASKIGMIPAVRQARRKTA